jgi:sugar (pentulose or hexulose) kinase
MKRNYLAFDLGASSGRAIVCRLENGHLSLTEVHRFVNGPVERGGALFWDFPALCAEIKEGLKKALAVEPGISGIAIDTWGVDYVLYSRATGQPLRLPYNYRDTRTLETPAKIFKSISKEDIYARTGIQFMNINTLYQLAAHREQHPEDFENSVLLFIPDALTNYLNGEFTCEYTIASTSNLLDPNTRDWDFELIDKLGIPRSIFPEIVMPSTVSAPLRPELQKELGCGPIPLIRVGAHDTASAVGAVPAAPDSNWAYISCGTWALLGAEIDRPLMTPAAEAAPCTNEGGLAGKIRFLTNIMGTWLFQETRRNWRAEGKEMSFARMEELAAAAEPWKFLINPNDGLFLGPNDMPGRIRRYCAEHGQGEPATDGEILRCVYDSLALCFREKLEKLENILNVRYQFLNIVGGGTQDHRLMQYTADALGIPVTAGPIEATAIGNAISQAIALGDVAGLNEGRRIVRDSFEVIEFKPAASRKDWDSAMTRFNQLAL